MSDRAFAQVVEGGRPMLPLQECDLVMKGGLTSGVVYPHVLTEISKDYRLRNIGGTSAGSIAAVFAAAAEYRRQEKQDPAAFDQIGEIAKDLAKAMIHLFQPTPSLTPLFAFLLASVSAEAQAGHRGRALVKAALRVFAMQWVVLAALVALAIWFGIRSGNPWLSATVVLAALFAVVLWVGGRVKRMIARDLPANDFGICTGKTMPGHTGQGFSDWICSKVNEIAGKTGDPLVVGDLRRHEIEVAAMTTDLSTGRPYQLPLKTRIHYFRKSEFARLFDEKVVDFLCRTGGAHESSDPSAPDDLYQLTVGDHFPVFLVARMSLSFPGLISCIPLWRYDDGLRSGEIGAMRRCLFSDGGISSNFPIHFFDSLLPQRPTFGIALGSWEAARHGGERVVLPTKGKQSTSLAVRPISTLGAFAASIVNTAKDWQDTMQSFLPGYADRIVTIRLDNKREGGMNLAMDSTTIDRLTGLGRQAGETLCTAFSYQRGGKAFDQHRYNRAISLLPKLEGALDAFDVALADAPEGAPGARSGREVLAEFDTAHHAVGKTWREKVFVPFADALAGLGRAARTAGENDGQTNLRKGQGLPSADTAFRLIAVADRQPRSAVGGDGADGSSGEDESAGGGGK